MKVERLVFGGLWKWLEEGDVILIEVELIQGFCRILRIRLTLTLSSIFFKQWQKSSNMPLFTALYVREMDSYCYAFS